MSDKKFIATIKQDYRSAFGSIIRGFSRRLICFYLFFIVQTSLCVLSLKIEAKFNILNFLYF